MTETLKMPSMYVEMQEEEMIYTEGGYYYPGVITAIAIAVGVAAAVVVGVAAAAGAALVVGAVVVTTITVQTAAAVAILAGGYALLRRLRRDTESGIFSTRKRFWK